MNGPERTAYTALELFLKGKNKNLAFSLRVWKLSQSCVLCSELKGQAYAEPHAYGEWVWRGEEDLKAAARVRRAKSSKGIPALPPMPAAAPDEDMSWGEAEMCADDYWPEEEEAQLHAACGEKSDSDVISEWSNQEQIDIDQEEFEQADTRVGETGQPEKRYSSRRNYGPSAIGRYEVFFLVFIVEFIVK